WSGAASSPMKTWGLRMLSQQVSCAMRTDCCKTPPAESSTRSVRSRPLGRNTSSNDSSGIAMTPNFRSGERSRFNYGEYVRRKQAGSRKSRLGRGFHRVTYPLSILEQQAARLAALLVHACRAIALGAAAAPDRSVLFHARSCAHGLLVLSPE